MKSGWWLGAGSADPGLSRGLSVLFRWFAAPAHGGRLGVILPDDPGPRGRGGACPGGRWRRGRRGSVSLKRSPGGSSGTSRPRRTISWTRRAMAILTAMALWRRPAARCRRSPVLHHRRAFHQHASRLEVRRGEIRRFVPGEQGADLVNRPNRLGRACHDHLPSATGPPHMPTRRRTALGVDTWGSGCLFCLSLSRRRRRRPRTGNKAI